MLLQLPRAGEEARQKPTDTLMLVLPMFLHRVRTEVLPEHPAVAPPPLTIREEGEDDVCATPVTNVEHHASRGSGERAYSSSIGVTLRSEVFADRLSRYSKTTSELPRTTTRWPRTWKCILFPTAVGCHFKPTVGEDDLPYLAESSR